MAKLCSMCTSYWQARPSGRSASWCRSRPRRAPRRAGALAGQPRPRDPQRPANLRAVPGPGPAPRPGRRAQRSAVVLLCVLPVLGPGRVRRPLPLVLRIVVPTVPLRALTLPGLFAGTRGRGGKRDAGRDRRRSGAGLSPYQLGFDPAEGVALGKSFESGFILPFTPALRWQGGRIQGVGQRTGPEAPADFSS